MTDKTIDTFNPIRGMIPILNGRGEYVKKSDYENLENGAFVTNEKQRQYQIDRKLKVATDRHRLFVECMELSAKITRSSDDVSDIISQCDKTSHYMANHFN